MRILQALATLTAAPLLTLPLLSSSTLLTPRTEIRSSLQFLTTNKQAYLLPPITVDSEALHCLALNVYHEARSEPEPGQIAVAQVTLNRVASGQFPDEICAVVQQGGQKLHSCQFSWWCDGKSDVPTEPEAWEASVRIAERVLRGQEPDQTAGALYYHAHYVNPSWSSVFEQTAEIGQHRFYRPQPDGS